MTTPMGRDTDLYTKAQLVDLAEDFQRHADTFATGRRKNERRAAVQQQAEADALRAAAEQR